MQNVTSFLPSFILRNTRTSICPLFATTKPARDTALRLGCLSLHLAVELVHLLQCAGLDVLRIRLGISLGLGELGLSLLGLRGLLAFMVLFIFEFGRNGAV